MTRSVLSVGFRPLPKTPPIVESHTGNLKLRPSGPSDQQDFVDLERDPEVMRFINGGAVDQKIDPEKVTFFMPRVNKPDVWTVQWIGDGVFVGWFCLASEGGAVGEIGYRLCRDAWGKGYESDAALKLVGWAFEAANVKKIVACTMVTNIGLRRVMEKIGMRHVRTFPFEAATCPGTERGEVWY